MKKLLIGLMAFALCTSQMHAMQGDTKSTEPLEEGAVDFGMYAALDSWAYTPDSARVENEQIRQYSLYMTSLRNKFTAMSKEELGNIRSSKESISSMNENERKVFIEAYNQKYNSHWYLTAIRIEKGIIENSEDSLVEELATKGGDSMIIHNRADSRTVTESIMRVDGGKSCSTFVENKHGKYYIYGEYAGLFTIRVDMVQEAFSKNAK